MKIDWKPILMKYLKIVLAAFLAGIMISLAGLAYLGISSRGYPVAGAVVASFGIMMIFLYGYHLFTAKVAYIPENNVLYLLDVALSFVGNFLGTLLMGLIIKGTKLMEDGAVFRTSLEVLCKSIAEENVLSVILMAMLCGLVIYLMINTYKKAEQPIARFGSLILGTMLFLLLGMEELSVDMFYVSCYKPFDGVLTLKLTYTAIGNIVGSLIIPLLNKLRGKMKSI